MCGSYRDMKSNLTLHHNIFASSRNRHPSLGGGLTTDYIGKLIDFRNNIIYNWGGPLDLANPSKDTNGHTKLYFCKFNLINNYFKRGALNGSIRVIRIVKSIQKTYLGGNVFDGFPEAGQFTKDNKLSVDWKYCEVPKEQILGLLQDNPIDARECTPVTQTAKEAYELVLAKSGCSLARDTVDVRLIDSIKNNVGKLIDKPEDVGGWDQYEAVYRPDGWDTDKDGMPDGWEKKYGLNPYDPNDRNEDVNGDGYTNLEKYLNWLTGEYSISSSTPMQVQDATTIESVPTERQD